MLVFSATVHILLPCKTVFCHPTEALEHAFGKDNINIGGITVKRYIRLTNLIPELLDLVDEERIAFTPAVDLSYLNEVEQADLVEEIRVCDATPNLSQAQRLRAISREEGLTPEHMLKLCIEELQHCEKETVDFHLPASDAYLVNMYINGNLYSFEYGCARNPYANILTEIMLAYSDVEGLENVKSYISTIRNN